MATIDTAWFIGSATIADTVVACGAFLPFAGGTYYLTDPTAARSLCATLETVLQISEATATVELLSSGFVRISADVPIDITWMVTNELRDLLGFDADLSGADTYTAPLHSPLWWSPGKPALFTLSPLGVTGQRRHNLSQSVSAYTGKTESTAHGSRLFQRFTFEKVDSERLKVADTDTALAGEYEAWFQQVAVPSARFKVYSAVGEDPAGTTEFTYDAVVGPYVQPLGSDASWNYQRSSGATWSDFCADISINANGCPEIT